MEVERIDQPQVTNAEDTLAQRTVTGERYGVSGRTNPDFLESMIGCFANDPAFDRVMQGIEAERARERQEAEQEAEREETFS